MNKVRGELLRGVGLGDIRGLQGLQVRLADENLLNSVHSDVCIRKRVYSFVRIEEQTEAESFSFPFSVLFHWRVYVLAG